MDRKRHLGAPADPAEKRVEGFGRGSRTSGDENFPPVTGSHGDWSVTREF